MASRHPAFRVLMAELARARQAAERGRPDEARAAIEAALAIDPENPQALELREQLGREAKRPPRGQDDAPAVGSPPPVPIDPRKAAGWSTFEQRIRERRAARCVSAAQEALARGDAPAARDAIAELAALVPAHAELGRLRELCAAASTPRPDVPGAVPGPPAAAAPMPAEAVTDPEPPRRLAPPRTEEPPTSRQPLARFRPENPPAERPLERTLNTAPPPVEQPRSDGAPARRHRLVLVAAAAVLLAGVLIPVGQSRLGEFRSGGGVDVELREPEGRPFAALTDEPAPPSVDAAPPAPPPPAEDEPVMTTGSGGGAGQGVESTPEAPPEPEPAAAAEAADPPRPAPQPQPQREDPPAPRRAAVDQEPEPAPEPVRTPPRPAVLPAASASAPAAAAPATDPMTGAMARVEPPPSPPPSRPEPLPRAPVASTAYVPGPSPVAPPQESGADGEAAVRDVLQRYVAAYNRLDAVAARAVWPAVNQGALERAFAQLDSQTLRFERCDISLEDAGGTATCRGQARWVPRVGGRDPRREARTWRFELTRSGDDWIITRAEARR